MREFAGFLSVRGLVWGLPLCLLAVACGSSDASEGASGVLSQAPQCPETTGALRIEGTIDGAAISDTRTTNINAGFENLSGGRFYTPVSDLAPLASNQLALTVTWGGNLFDGQVGPASGGTLTLPATHPHAGAKFCVSKGQVGFVSGGAEDGVLKFALTEVKAGADCSGAATAVDVRGCYH